MDDYDLDAEEYETSESEVPQSQSRQKLDDRKVIEK